MTQDPQAGAEKAPDQTAVSMERLTKVYIKMRERITSLEKEISDIEAQRDQITAAMKDLLRSVGGTSMRTEHGLVSLRTSTRYTATDWDAMHQFILDRQLPQLLEKRIAQTNMKDWLEANPQDVPPGLNTTSEVSVTVTKPRK